jgi:hypothetical protein
MARKGRVATPLLGGGRGWVNPKVTRKAGITTKVIRIRENTAMR